MDNYEEITNLDNLARDYRRIPLGACVKHPATITECLEVGNLTIEIRGFTKRVFIDDKEINAYEISFDPIVPGEPIYANIKVRCE